MTLRFLFLFLGSLLIVSSSTGQELDVPKAYDLGVKSIENGQFDAGLAAVDEIISKHGANGKANYGAVFGQFYYLKGMLHIQKKDYQKAAEAFRICHDQYQNRDGKGLPNRFIAEALAQWGGCLMSLKDYAGAATKYQAALAIVEQEDPKLDRLETQVNLSKAMMLAGNAGKGKDFISKNLDDPNFPDPMKRSLFLILMSDWSGSAGLREVSTYVDKYKSLMESDTLVNRYEKQNPVYSQLASQAIQAEEPGRALFWYNLMINPVKVGKAYTARINQLKEQVAQASTQLDLVKQINANIATLEADVRNQAIQLGQILLGKGSAYYAKGNLDEAKKTYLELIQRFPKHPEKPVVILNVAICSLNLSQWADAAEFGTQFFREFPDHELRPSMARVLVDGLFLQKKYDEAFRVATKLAPSLTIGSEAADVPEFVAAASLYHLNRFEESEPALAKYVATHPTGARIESAKFYLGSNKVNLQKWDEAIKILDEFLEHYEASEIRPSALYFSGLSHMVKQNYPVANSRIIELQARHPLAEEVPNSYNILGDILAARENPESEITAAYLKALDLVETEKRGDPGSVGGYALRQLITEANSRQKWDLATNYYDRFTKNYQTSAWRTDVLIAALEPLVATKRKAEAEKLLTDFVNEFADKPNSSELDEMFGTYADFLKQHSNLDEVRKSLQNFPAKTTPPPPALKAWLYMAEIEALGEADATKYQEEIKNIFGKLNELYQKDGKALSNYTLVKLARYNGKNGANESQARNVYEYILRERPNGTAMGLALVDLAKLDASKPDQKAQATSKALFQRILNEIDDTTLHEDAVLGIARIETALGNYGEAQKWWTQYRENPAWRTERAEASFQYGVCLRETGKADEAAATFVNVYSNFPGQLDWSTGAYIEAAKIIKAKDQELDAMKLLREMIQRMGHLDHPRVEEGRKLFFEWRTAYTEKQKK